MDTEQLVETQFDDGDKLLEQLVRDDFPVAVAFWVRTSEEGLWQLFIASSDVDGNQLGGAYHKVYASLDKLANCSVSPSDIKLLGDEDPIATTAIELRNRHAAQIPTRYHGERLGPLSITEAYIYPPKKSPRLAFRVTYVRHGDTNTWQTTTKRGRLYDIPAKGAVSYSTALWEGQTTEDQRHATVSVLVEIDPSFDNPANRAILDLPEVRKMMADQARRDADAMFKERHPGAVIEHDEDED